MPACIMAKIWLKHKRLFLVFSRDKYMWPREEVVEKENDKKGLSVEISMRSIQFLTEHWRSKLGACSLHFEKFGPIKLMLCSELQ